jgi:hypothetical protein
MPMGLPRQRAGIDLNQAARSSDDQRLAHGSAPPMSALIGTTRANFSVTT